MIRYLSSLGKGIGSFLMLNTNEDTNLGWNKNFSFFMSTYYVSTCKMRKFMECFISSIQISHAQFISVDHEHDSRTLMKYTNTS